MGAGKTTCGKILSDQLSKKHYDLDDVIVKKTGQTIRKIFEVYSESGFRTIESQELSKVSNICNSVISTGGGCVVSEVNRNIIKNSSGIVIYLAVSVSSQKKRLKSTNDRPLIADLELMSDRYSIYNSMADIKIDTDPLSATQVCSYIIKKLETLNV